MDLEELLLPMIWLVPIWIGFVYFVVPIFVKFSQVYPARPDFVPLDWDDLKRSHADFLRTQTEELFALGFESPTLLECVKAVPNVRSYWIYVAHPTTLDEAVVVVMIATSGPVKITAKVVEFVTTFHDGSNVDTMNSDVIQAYPPKPTTIFSQVPAADTATRLYRVHQHVMAKECASLRPVRKSPELTIVERLQNSFAELYERQVPRGVLFYTESDDCYRPTFLGAYRLCWKLMGPAKWYLQWRMAVNGRRLLAEAEAAR